MHSPTRSFAAAVAVAALALTGCGSDESSAGDEPPSPTEEAHSDHGGSGNDGEDGSETGEDNGGDAEEIEVSIEGGEVSPSGERVDAKVGETIRLVVDSDVGDELHVHTVPEETFQIAAGKQDQVFEFTVETPGVVDVELHKLGDVVVSIAVQP